MTIIISPNPQPIEDAPNPMFGPEGSTLVTAIAYPEYFTLTDGEEVDTLQLDFVSPTVIDPGRLRSLMEGVLGDLLFAGDDLLAYALYRGVAYDLVIPDRIWIGIISITPPYANETVASLISYRFWLLKRKRPELFPSSVSASPRPLAFLSLVAIILGVLAGIGLIAGIIGWQQGKVTWREISDLSKAALRAPGENIAAPISALAWPLAALGVAVVAAGIYIPLASARATAAFPVGPGKVSIVAGGGGRR